MVATPAMTATSTAPLGYTPAALPPALFRPLLVLPSPKSCPPCPFEVASTLGSTPATCVPRCAAVAVVANVIVLVGVDSPNALLDINTSANPGAGTVTVHVFAVWSHGTVSTCCEPCRRPSEENWPPKV